MELGEGVIGILGQNGTGKSTLVEAVAWAIYGNESSIVRDGKDGVRWSGASQNEECRVTVDFDLETDHYRLSRSLKGKSQKTEAVLIVNEMQVANGDEAVTGEMVKRLGMDHKAFFVSVFARQKDLAALSVLRPAERKKLVLSMLGIDQLDRVVDEISADSRATKQTLEALGTTLRTADGKDRGEITRCEIAKAEESISKLRHEEAATQAKMAELEKYVHRAKADMERVEKRSLEHQLARAKVLGLESDLRNMTSRREQVEKDLRALDEKALALPELEKLEEEHRRVDSERELLEDARVKHSQLESLQKLHTQKKTEMDSWQMDLAGAGAELSSLGDYESVISKAEEVMQRYDESILNAKEEAAWKIKDCARLEREIAEKKARMDDVHRLGPDSICPTCERRMDAQHDVLVRKMEQEIAEAVTSLKDLHERRQKGDEFIAKNQRLKSVQEQKRKDALKVQERAAALKQRQSTASSGIVKIKEDLDRVTRQVQQLGVVRFDPVRYDAARKRQAELKPSVDRLMRLRTELLRVPVMKSELAGLQQRIADTDKELEEARKTLTTLSFDPEELRISRERYAKERDFKEAAQSTLSQQREDLARQESTLGAAISKLEELEEATARAEHLRMRLLELNVLLQVMKDFRANVTSRILPTLSRNASELFGELTEGKYAGLEIDDDYEMHILDNGGRFELGRFSGGESDLANLCLRLAISRLIAERSGQHVNFLVLDEIFGSQDAVRKRNILRLLSSLQRQFGQILLITHIEDIKDAVDDLVVVREMQDGSSALRGEDDG